MTHLLNEIKALGYIMDHARARDVREIEALFSIEFVKDFLEQFWATAAFKQLFYGADGVPVAFLAFHPLGVNFMSASMIATPEFKSVARQMIRWGVKKFKPEALKMGYRRVECRTIEGHQDAINLLERLGFRLECVVPDMGAPGEVFLQYAWRISDHVLLDPKTNHHPGPSASAEGRCDGSEGSRTSEARAG